ncbi:unnamed protein product [Phyllotreta striolata]|uniref:Uncharacterized protein n=1 Tax=Phyllotreta striolata TaxID=444603 RepID=A0A9N9TPZ1_PHYSR|nr:unnamed protein product [Phyllotreta striolata]
MKLFSVLLQVCFVVLALAAGTTFAQRGRMGIPGMGRMGRSLPDVEEPILRNENLQLE